MAVRMLGSEAGGYSSPTGEFRPAPGSPWSKPGGGGEGGGIGGGDGGRGNVGGEPGRARYGASGEESGELDGEDLNGRGVGDLDILGTSSLMSSSSYQQPG